MFSSDENVLDELGDGMMLQCGGCEGGDVVVLSSPYLAFSPEVDDIVSK